MADVSGYTALSERYNNSGKGGTYRLTVTLNTYLGALIELIYSQGGDIIKFAGDAFLALWKTDKRTFLCHTIHTVITCALIIQHSYASYETDVKVNLKVKLAISAGNLIFAPIGTGIDMSYVIFGLPVIEAKAAESVCASGEVRLAATAWEHCYSRNYDYVVHDDGHVTIKAILYDPREKDVTKPFVGFGSLVSQIKKPLSAIENNPEFLWESPKNLSVTDSIRRNEALSLRKAILDTEEKNIGSEIRKFMIRPVLTQIDAHQPLEYLTEMRQVSILFLTLKPRDCSSLQLITIVNNSYQITCEIVYKSMGCVNKIILFDKDVMILVIFGLRGFKHESEAQAALKCAYNIKKSVSALDGVTEVSIGVTTGQVYCGVVGHPLRREFTVIGAIVNKAARLMCGFRNKITCDESTFVKSKMSSNGFTLQPSIELKGIGQPGKIYEYSEEIRVKALYDIPMTPPLLDRVDEMEYFENWLNDSHLSYRDFDALLLVGDARIGKSRMLEWMARYTKNRGLRVCYINLTSVHSATPYWALSQIINQILDLKEPLTGFIKEEKIVQLLKVYNGDLCYLNHIIKVRFAYHEGVNLQSEEERKEKAKEMFSLLVKSIIETHVIFLDDLQNLDSASWEFISIMFKSQRIFTVLSVTRGKFGSVQNWLYDVFINSNVRKIVLEALSNNWIAPLACQILDVKAVPKDLYNALLSKCSGVPGLIENFIVHLFSNGALEIKKVYVNELYKWEDEHFLFPDSDLLHPQALNTADQATLDKLIQDDSTGEINICIVVEKDKLKTNIDVQNIDALVMIQIDSLTPYQQLLLKIASVIGNVLSRDLLENIMYENEPLTTAKAIKRLFAMRMLSCANNKCHQKGSSNDTLLSNISENLNLVCDCSFDYDECEDNENLPKYAFCKIMKFRNKNTRRACYELLPINQKKEFHSRIVYYLENNKQKCLDCGGSITVVQSSVSLESEIIECDIRTIPEEDNLNSESDEERDLDSEEVINNSTSFDNEGPSGMKKSKSESLNDKGLSQKKTSTTLSATMIKENGPKTCNRRSSRFTSILRTRNEDENVSNCRRSTKRVTMTNFYFKQINSTEMDVKIFDMLRSVLEAKNISDWRHLGAAESSDDNSIIDDEYNSEKKSFSIKIEKGVSATNISKCTCADLNIIITEQLIYHAKQAELKLKAIDFILKYCYLNLLNNYFDNILPQLEEAEEMCTNIDGQTPEKQVNEVTKRRFLGKIHSIRAATFLMTGKLTAAKHEIEQATRIYHINLHKMSEFLKLRGLISSMSFKGKKRLTNKMLVKADSIFCLNVATVLYASIEDFKTSRISAFQAIELVKNIDCNVIDMCDAFSNAIQVELDREAIESTADLERLVLQVLSQLPRSVQIDELFAIGKLFMTIFRGRMARAQLARAIRSGFRAITISRFLEAHNISLVIIPDLFYVLMSKCRIEEAIDILQLTVRLEQYHTSHDCETWYYALCMDMILDAGFQLESPFEISRFAESNLGKAVGPNRRRLVVGLWTYWLRANNERKSKQFEEEALSFTEYEEDNGSLTSLLSALRLAEGMLESLARKVDDLRKVEIFF